MKPILSTRETHIARKSAKRLEKLSKLRKNIHHFINSDKLILICDGNDANCENAKKLNLSPPRGIDSFLENFLANNGNMSSGGGHMMSLNLRLAASNVIHKPSLLSKGLSKYKI